PDRDHGHGRGLAVGDCLFQLFERDVVDRHPLGVLVVPAPPEPVGRGHPPAAAPRPAGAGAAEPARAPAAPTRRGLPAAAPPPPRGPPGPGPPNPPGPGPPSPVGG